MMLWHQPLQISTQAFGLFYAPYNGFSNDDVAGQRAGDRSDADMNIWQLA
jgi:hypothetical protein